MLRLLPVAAGIVVTLGIAGAFGGLPASSESTTTTASPSATPSPTVEPTWPAMPWTAPATPAATNPAITPAPAWSPPSWYTGPLKPGDWVRITGTESCLNVRVSPALYQHAAEGDTDMPVLNCLPDGFVGQLSFGPNSDWSPGQELPVQADGYSWWFMLGQGWVADQWLAFEREEGAPMPLRPELSGAGLIAFVRSDGLWLANADGTSSQRIFASDKAGVSSARWSPDGQRIVVAVSNWDGKTAEYVADVLDLEGAVVAEYPGLWDPAWSPDGRYLSGLRSHTDSPSFAVPMVVDLATGVETPVGPAAYYSHAAEVAPDGSAVALVCYSGSWQEQQPDGTIVTHSIDCGGDGVRIVSLVDSSVRVVLPADNTGSVHYDNPRWSPDGSKIAVYETGGDCNGYVLLDAASGTRSSCLVLPSVASLGFGCGGGGESGASDWSPDAQTLAYHWQFGSGQNGVALVNVATGDRKMILSTQASSISFSGDGAHLTYESAGYVWTADSDATDVQRLTDGWAPVWQPQP